MRGVQIVPAGPDVIGGNPGLQRPRHTAVAMGQHAMAKQLRHRQTTPGQELQRGDLARLLGTAIGQVGLEDRMLADGEDLVAVLFLQQPGPAIPRHPGPAPGHHAHRAMTDA
jgi:hypothetical protein